MRKINETGLAHIKKWEGMRLKAYQDAGGIWTIGYGHTARAGEPQPHRDMVISRKAAEEILLQDLDIVEKKVEYHVKVPLSDNQFAALVSFCFNVGGTAFARSTLLKKLNKGDYESVPLELGRWVYAKGKRVSGLVNRRSAESGLWVRGAFVASQATPCHIMTKNLFQRPEIVGTSVGALAGLSGLVSGQGPFQWALAFIMIVAFLLAVWLFIGKRENKH